MLILPPIPDKEFFSISEVSAIAQMPAYVLRYWESEFKTFRPARRASGQRKFTRKDIELIFQIKDLLYNKKYTIAGARKHLFNEKRKKDPEPVQQLNVELKETNKENEEVKKAISEAKIELEELLNILK